MTYDTLATDYDGTLACEGRVDDRVLDGLRRARQAGRTLVMVTGRELSDLFNVFPHSHLFDRIVAENGAVAYDPHSQKSETLATPPPPALLDRLAQQGVPFSAGHVIVATVEPYEHRVLTALRDLGIEWHVIFNKGAVMALPSSVTKATGLAPALASLGTAPARTIGIGDAENDQAFLRLCGLAVAVADALPAVKGAADLVTDGGCGEGVVEIIGRWLAGELDAVGPDPKKHL